MTEEQLSSRVMNCCVTVPTCYASSCWCCWWRCRWRRLPATHTPRAAYSTPCRHR